MSDINQIVMSTLLNAVNSNSLNRNSLNNTSYDFSSVLSNTLGRLTNSNPTGCSCNNSNTNMLDTLNTLLGSVNYNKINYPQTINEVNLYNNSKQLGKMDKAIELLENQLGKKYIWGADGPNSFDCSGLVQYVYKNALGKDIPRVSYEQAKFGQAVKKEDLQVGDLVFFDTMNKGRVSHVGMYVGNNEFIHASNPKDGVKKSTLSGFYEKTYIGARRP
ncbi:MAG: C40 family peptidase [Peptostreptococcaceae bacterium]|nr:C40 family peptidase [Peptostreptococcaceae bacterium]